MRLLVTALILLSSHAAWARDYRIVFAQRKSNAVYNDRFPVRDRHFRDDITLAIWGTSGNEAANFLNGSSHSIAAAEFRANTTTARFATDCSGGDLFQEVWVSPDRTRIIYKNATTPVEPNDWYWLQATPSSVNDPTGRSQFQALFHDTDPPIPDGWTRLQSHEADGDQKQGDSHVASGDEILEAEAEGDAQQAAEAADRQFFGDPESRGVTSHFNFDNRVFDGDPNPPTTTKYRCFVECVLDNGQRRFFSARGLNQIEIDDWRTLQLNDRHVQVVKCRFWWRLSNNGRMHSSRWAEAEDGNYIVYAFLVWHGRNESSIEQLTTSPLSSEPAATSRKRSKQTTSSR